MKFAFKSIAAVVLAASALSAVAQEAATPPPRGTLWPNTNAAHLAFFCGAVDKDAQVPVGYGDGANYEIDRLVKLGMSDGGAWDLLRQSAACDRVAAGVKEVGALKEQAK